MEQEREQFASRLGFILMTAGCAIGLGNVWRFPYITGAYGGGLFVFLYLFFLAVLGFPVMMMELAAGRAARRTLPGTLRQLSAPRAAASGPFRDTCSLRAIFCCSCTTR